MKLPDNENLTAVRERILPVLKKYRAVLAVLLAGVLLLTSGHSGNTEQVQTASADTTVSQSFDLNDFQQELQARLAAISGAWDGRADQNCGSILIDSAQKSRVKAEKTKIFFQKASSGFGDVSFKERSGRFKA